MSGKRQASEWFLWRQRLGRRSKKGARDVVGLDRKPCGCVDPARGGLGHRSWWRYTELKRKGTKPLAVVLNTGALGIEDLEGWRWKLFAEQKAVSSLPAFLFILQSVGQLRLSATWRTIIAEEIVKPSSDGRKF
jgi:hypothetical protein